MLKLADFIVHKVYHNEADEREKKNQEMKQKKVDISSDSFQSDQKHDSPLSNDQIVLS